MAFISGGGGGGAASIVLKFGRRKEDRNRAAVAVELWRGERGGGARTLPSALYPLLPCPARFPLPFVWPRHLAKAPPSPRVLSGPAAQEGGTARQQPAPQPMAAGGGGPAPPAGAGGAAAGPGVAVQAELRASFMPELDRFECTIVHASNHRLPSHRNGPSHHSPCKQL